MTVEFENSVDPSIFAREKPIPTLPRLVIKLGLAKNESQANIVLIILSSFLIIIALYLILKSDNPQTLDVRSSPPPPPTINTTF